SQITQSPNHPITKSTPSHEIDDLDLVPFGQFGRVVAIALDHGEVALDGDAAGIDVEPRQQIGDRARRRGVVGLAVELNRHSGLSNPNGASSARSVSSRSGARCAGMSPALRTSPLRPPASLAPPRASLLAPPAS